MENRTQRLTDALLRSRSGRIAVLAALMLALGFALAPLVGDRAPPSAAAAAEQSLVVDRQPFSTVLNLTGVIVPGDGLDVTAPFDGVITAIGFSYGERVAAGQMLVEIDASELQQQRNSAESAYLKAKQAAEEMEGWADGPEVARARRALASAERDVQEADRSLSETGALLERGLVPRMEYDGRLQQKLSSEMALMAAREDLEAVLKRGQAANRRVAQLELQNARARLEKLSVEFEQAVVMAPEGGVIVRPPDDGVEGAQGAVHVGQRIAKGAFIGSIARAGGLAVAFQVDESDVNRLAPGQPVRVTGAGFGGRQLTGKVESVAGQAEASTLGAKATFSVKARLDPLTLSAAAAVRIGMSANVELTIYDNPAAIVLPPEAIGGGADNAFVLVRDAKNRPPRRAPVQIGYVSPNAVEIRAGLEPRETVIWGLALSRDGEEAAQ